MSDVTQFEPPEGLHAHEVPCFLGVQEEWFERSLAAAYLELADNGSLTIGPDKRPVRQAVPGVALTPFQEKVAGLLAGRTRLLENLLDWRKLIWARLAEQGWVDAATGRPTPEGLAVRGRLIGYRDYLRKAMTDRVHHAAIEGRVDRDMEFAAGLGIMELPNVYRAVALRFGLPIEGIAAAMFNVLGGKPSEQHATSYRGNRPPGWCIAILALWIGGFIALFAYAWMRQRP